MKIWTTLSRAVELYPRKVGVVDGGSVFTYGELGERVCALANYLRSRGVGPGDRVSILHVNSHEFLEMYYATAGIGAVLVPINIRLSPWEIRFILDDSGSTTLVADSGFAPLVEAVLEEANPLQRILWVGEMPSVRHPVAGDHYETCLSSHRGGFVEEAVTGNEVAHLYYTSGTTGRPKGVMLTHDNVCVHALGAVAELHLTDTDVWAHVAPMFHLADAWATFAVTWVGGSHVMIPHFQVEAVLAAIQGHTITLTNLIPTMLNMMVNHPKVLDYDYSSLRVILSGGAPIAPELVRRVVETFGCDYIQTYGMTETSPYLTLSVLKEHLRHLPPEAQLVYKAKTGRPFIAVDLRVVNEKGEQVRQDEREVGEIWVRGDTVTPGYWNLPEETEKAFHHGWLRTGDLAVVDEEGYVTIVDRKKDMIITGGENVYSIEVEKVLYSHPKVMEAAVFGVADDKWGEAVRAAVVLRPGETATQEEIIDFCKGRLASYKAPKSIEFLSELPKTGSGKIAKRLLRDRAAPSGSTAGDPR